MKDHTLMQTIARANRVCSYVINGVSKRNGEIIDYYNVFRNMKKALAVYALGSGDGKEGEPVQEKSVLFELLDDALEQGAVFCREHGIDLTIVLRGGETFKKIGVFERFADKILEKNECKKQFIVYENTITSLYEACKPEILTCNARPLVFVFQYLRGIIDSIVGQADIDKVKQKIAELLDQSVVTDNEGRPLREHYAEFQIIQKGKTWDLSKINFDKLKEEFKDKEYKNIEIADLRSFIENKLEIMLRDNSTRTDYAQKLQEIIDNYNAGGSSTENYFDDLVNFTENLKNEDERHIREGLSKDELEIFDTLKKDKMTKDEEKKVKLAAKDLLHRLLEEYPRVLVQDWYKDSQSQRKVRSTIEDVLDKDLPESYDRVEFKKTCDKTYDLIYEYTSKGLKWAA